MAGLLPVAGTPCLSTPAAWSNNVTRTSSLCIVEPTTRGLLSSYRRRGYASRAKGLKLSVRADASLSELSPNVAAVYGSLLLGGGLFAYSRSSSTGSLAGGIIGGASMALVFILSLDPGRKDLAEALGFGFALLFVAIFGIRYAATKKVFPSVPLLLMSVMASGVFVGAYLQNRL